MRSWPCLIHLLAGWFSSGQPRLEPVEHVDLPRYMGSWYVIAICDNPVERPLTAAMESYAHRGDGRIDVHFQWRSGSLSAPRQEHRFTARVIDRPANARWRVQIFPLVFASYVIIALDEKYRWAAVAHPSRKFGWILARAPSIPDSVWKDLLAVFQEQGYDPAQFRKVPHSAA